MNLDRDIKAKNSERKKNIADPKFLPFFKFKVEMNFFDVLKSDKESFFGYEYIICLL